jgi:predicted ferric reductase
MWWFGNPAGFGRTRWTGLYALATSWLVWGISWLVWGRVLRPLRLNLRHRLRVVAVVPEPAGTFSVYLGGRRLDRLDARAGQYFRWRFLGSGGWWQPYPFSLSAAPNQHWLRLTVSASGAQADRLRQLRTGTRVIATRPPCASANRAGPDPVAFHRS